DPPRRGLRRAVRGLRPRARQRSRCRPRAGRRPRNPRVLMSRPFVLPDLGEGLVEAEVVRVLVTEGQVVSEDAPLLEVETDKAQVEIPSPMSGRVGKVHVAPHQTVRVGGVLVTLEEEGGGGPAAVQRSARARTTPVGEGMPPPPAPAPGDARPATATTQPPVGPVPATPATRRLARELGID